MRAANLAAETNNFLLPNGTFIVESIIILVVLFIFFRFIVPPVRQALREREEMVQKGHDEARDADEKFRLAEERYHQALAEARAEAASIRDTARAEGQKILDEFRSRAGAEVAELRQQAAEQLAGERERVLAEVEPRVRDLAGALASRVTGEEVAAQSRARKGGR
jgi:F-type H+-transporting ATPase subunit b